MKHPFAHYVLALALGLAACGGRQRGADEPVLAVGADVPALVRVDHRGQVVSLRSNKPTLVYFYPKDGTPGCTKEACAFRDAWQRYERAGLRVIGVSTDSVERHRSFAEEHGLPFSLIADPEQVWSKAFGVRSFAGLDERKSFLLNAQNQVVKVYDDVDPGVHAEEVLRDAYALGLTTIPP